MLGGSTRLRSPDRIVVHPNLCSLAPTTVFPENLVVPIQLLVDLDMDALTVFGVLAGLGPTI